MPKPEPTKPAFASSADNLTFARLIKAVNKDPKGWRVNLKPPGQSLPTIEFYDETQSVAPQQFFFNRADSAEQAAKYLGITTTV